MERAFGADEHMRAMFELMQKDQDGAQGPGHWKRYLHLAFDRLSRALGYRFGDLRAISAPALIVVGDRDQFCTVEEGATAFRALPRGELAILPNTGHVITEAKVRASIEFLRRV